MDYVETEGSSIDEAIANALKELGAERAKVEIEILASATRGLFGIGGKKARVRASLRRPIDASAEAPRGAEKRQSAGVDAAEEAPTGREEAPTGREEAHQARQRPAPRQKPASSQPQRSPQRVPERRPRVEAALAPLGEATVAHARSLLEDLITRMGFTAAVDVGREEDLVVLGIRGESSSVLIGRRGQTLDALEYLINRIVTREDDKNARIVVDCEQYREKRRRSLEDLAQRMAERAKRRGKVVTLNPMSPRDRRIIHLALQEDTTLITRSSGKGYYRKLLIIPEGERRSGSPRPRREAEG